MENEILSWAYWGSDKSEIIRNIGLVLAAFLAFPFLVWRTIAQNKSANAALKSSMAALKQSEASLAQSENSRNQAAAALEQVKISSKQIDLLIRNRFFEYMTKAFEQLSTDNPNGRLGAIYTLERLAAESEEDRYAVMQVLTQYLVSTSEFSHDEYLDALGINKEEVDDKITSIPHMKEELKYIMPESTRRWPPAAPDKEAILNILGGKVRDGILGKHFLSFQGATLQGAKIYGLDFSKCSFMYSNLSGVRAAHAKLEEANLAFALLIGAELHEANLKNSVLTGAKMTGANLEKADLSNSILEGADLERAILTGANLENAKLQHANLSGANLSDVKGLTQDQLNDAYGDSRTTIPPGLVLPTRKPNKTN